MPTAARRAEIKRNRAKRRELEMLEDIAQRQRALKARLKSKREWRLLGMLATITPTFAAPKARPADGSHRDASAPA